MIALAAVAHRRYLWADDDADRQALRIALRAGRDGAACRAAGRLDAGAFGELAARPLHHERAGAGDGSAGRGAQQTQIR